METFEIATLGCKVNQCESQLLLEQLNALGLREAAPGESADICIVNTCAVTATAQSKSLKALRRFRRENAGARVVAIGCGVSASPQRYSQADLLVRQEEKEAAVSKVLGREAGVDTVSAFSGHVRAFLKAQDGCDSFCTYCIVPYLRGRPRSRRWEEIEREARALARGSYNELVLAGTHLGLYGKDLGGGEDLTTVVERLLELGLFPRLRLSGVEVNEVTQRLIELIAQENALCPHLHIPLQSGSAEVLREMGRAYTPSEYLRVVERIRDSEPLCAITTDVIAGFPTEEPRHFEETLELCARAGFSRMHIFPYSRRSPTAAAKKWKSGAVRDKSLRAKELRALGAQLATEFAGRFTGETVRVLAESRKGRNMVEGYTDHYLRAEVEGPHVPVGALVEGTATSSRAGVLSVRASEIVCGSSE